MLKKEKKSKSKMEEKNQNKKDFFPIVSHPNRVSLYKSTSYFTYNNNVYPQKH